MSFCANCGRQHEPDARFCAGCGAELTPEGEQAPAAENDQASAVATSPVAAAENTAENEQTPATENDRADERGQTVVVQPGPPGDATRIDQPAGRPDPFASWYRPATGGGADDGYMPTQTVGVGSGRPGGYPGQPQPGGYPPPAQPGGYPPPGQGGYQPPAQGGYQSPATPVAPPFPPAGGPNRGGRRGLFAVLAVVIVLAVGGGTYALATTLGGRTTASPSPGPSSSAPATSPASVPASGSASASPSPTPTPTPSPTLSLVAVAPGVTSVPASVQTLLSHYFNGINNHDYTEYAATLSATERARQSEKSFTSGYSTTSDSGMTLTSLAGSSGGLTATVTFTSHQSASQSVDKSACNDWTLSLSLAASGSGYLIGPQPSGYHPDYSDC
jgi:hypothetical protein